MCLLGNMASGGAAGATSLLVVYPLDFARTRLAMDTGVGKAREFTGTFDCIMKTAKASGWGKGGVYNGFMVSCVGIVAYRGAYFGLYDTVADIDAMRGAGFAAKFALGYSVTVTAGLISYPLDTIRRRMMMTSGGKDAGKYKNSIDCARQILATEGIKSMYKGAGSNILRGLAGALVLVSFDYCKNFYCEHTTSKSTAHASAALAWHGRHALTIRLSLLLCMLCTLVEWKYPELRGQKKEIKIQFG
jgi:solute carrier family 25 (adenine nucleotide translocator) protein 4/5/6/31